MHTRTSLILAGLVLHGTMPGHAQTGRADLRYVAPLPAVLSVMTVDTIETTMEGGPGAGVVSGGALTTINELRFAPGPDGVQVTARTIKVSGAFTGLAGSVPVDVGAGEPIKFTLPAKGPDPESMNDVFATLPSMGAATGAMMQASRAATGLMPLPDRQLRLGESWVDTIRANPGAGGLAAEGTMIVRGTYAADTVVAGKTLNVLRISSEFTMKASGSMQGTKIAPNVKQLSEESVLWDSREHVPLFRMAVTRTDIEIAVPQSSMTARVRLEVCSTTKAEPAR
jgi:hypothetical protein